MRMRWFLNRMKVLWKFIHMKDEARTLELEIQKARQTAHDLSFANDKENHLYKKGIADGIEWCLKRFPIVFVFLGITGWSFADTGTTPVVIVGPNPLPISGQFTSSPPALTTVTVNGVAQPVTSTYTTVVSTGIPITTSSPLTVVSTGIPIIPSTVGQPVISTYTTVVSTGIPVTSLSPLTVVSTGVPIIPNVIAQAVTSTYTTVVSTGFKVVQTTVATVGIAGLGSAPAGSPLYMGVSVTSTSFLTGQAQNTMVGHAATSVGQALMTGVPFQLTSSTFSLNLATQSATDTIIIASATTSRYNYLCNCTFGNSAATATTIFLYQSQFNTVGAAFFPVVIPTSSTVSVGVGCMDPFFRSQINGQITIKPNATIASVLMNCLYYVGP